jgi:quercetin dioxygenase-like cupin family protein
MTHIHPESGHVHSHGASGPHTHVGTNTPFHTTSGKEIMSGAHPPDKLDPRTNGEVFQIWQSLVRDDIEVHYTHIGAGQNVGAHSHPDASHFLIIIDGIAHAWLDGETVRLEPGDFLEIPRYTVHDFAADPSGDVWDLSVTHPGWDVQNMDYDVEAKEAIREALRAQFGKPKH